MHELLKNVFVNCTIEIRSFLDRNVGQFFKCNSNKELISKSLQTLRYTVINHQTEKFKELQLFFSDSRVWCFLSLTVIIIIIIKMNYLPTPL